jgi:NAD(P)-dependent dehydrogenase (short-subunit alcohol dehydrogenase family)
MNSTADAPIVLVLGAGAGIGATTAARFAAEGYRAVLCRRTDQAGLDAAVDAIQKAGGWAQGHLLDATAPEALEALIEETETRVGPIDTVIFNLGGQIGDRSLADTSPKTFERVWRMAALSLYRTAYAVLPVMAARGRGNLFVTASTAALRGNPGQHAHAAAMGARRLLCQSLNAEYAAQGIHVAHLVVDGAVDAPDTLGKMLGPDRFAALRAAKGGEAGGLISPEAVAETYLYLARQPRSSWTFELDLRSHSDRAWWN